MYRGNPGQTQQQFHNPQPMYQNEYYDDYDPNQSYTYNNPSQPQNQYRPSPQPQYQQQYQQQPPMQRRFPQQQAQLQFQQQDDDYYQDESFMQPSQLNTTRVAASTRQQQQPQQQQQQTLTPAQKLELKLRAIPQYQQATDSFIRAKSRLLVAVRCRPLGSRELEAGNSNIVKIPYTPNYNAEPIIGQPIEIHQGKLRLDMTPYTEIHSFSTDQIFGIDASNEQIYQRMVQPLVRYAIGDTGGRATCFAYGQTGSGKTFTMMGNEGADVPGLYSLAVIEVFQNLRPELTLGVSFFEIYGEKLFDLLNNKTRLFDREDENGNVVIAGLSEQKVSNPDEVLAIINKGMKLRAQAATGANADSSRSHAVLQFIFKKQDNKKPSIDTNKSLSKGMFMAYPRPKFVHLNLSILY